MTGLRALAQIAIVSIAAVSGACMGDGDIGEPGPDEQWTGPGAVPGTGPGTTTPVPPLTTAETEAYLAKIAPPIVGRVLTAVERVRITSDGPDAIEPILRAWVKEPGFVEMARNLIETKLSVSGTKEGIDFRLPGNLAAHIVRASLPWSNIVTATECFDATDKAVPCDTGAPYQAGVLTTRAYLVSRVGRFNLTRSSAMLSTFACRQYPQEDELQPRLPKEVLIPMFRAMSAADQPDERAKSGFGNGMGCYVCHGQFSAHAQLFVKFDGKGMWRKDADGIQDPVGELGRSKNDLMASHMVDPAAAASEKSQLFGTPVKDLSDAAKVLVKSPTFLQCAARNVVQYTLGTAKAPAVPPTLLASIAEKMKLASADPTFGEIVVTTLMDPSVERSIVASVTEPESKPVEPTGTP